MSPTSVPRQQQEPGSGRRGHEARSSPSPCESSLAPARLSFPVLCWLEQPQASPDARGGDGGRAVPPTLQVGFQKRIRDEGAQPTSQGTLARPDISSPAPGPPGATNAVPGTLSCPLRARLPFHPQHLPGQAVSPPTYATPKWQELSQSLSGPLQLTASPDLMAVLRGEHRHDPHA